MPLTGEQSNFVTKYISKRTAMKTIRAARDTLGDIPVGAATAKAGLEEKLADTGRVLDTRLPLDDRASASEDRREKHLQDILLRDEDGLNANQIVLKLAPVTEQEYKDARREPTDATDALVVDAAKAKLEKQRAMQRYVADEIIAKREAEETTNGHSKRMATNIAIADMASRVNQGSLAHHASRHGPATTIEQHITRIATGFAPDDPLPSTLLPTDVVPITTRSDTAGGVTGDPVNANVPKVGVAGPHYATGASRTGSGEAALYMIEDALAQIHESSMYNQANSGDTFVVKTLARTGDVSVGEAAMLEKNSGGQTLSAPVSGAQTPLSSRNAFHNTLNTGTATAKNAEIKARAEAILIQRDIKQSRIIIETLPDGSFRTITAFPDANVTADSFEKNNAAENLATQRATAQADALNAAQTAATDARAASDAAILNRSGELATKQAEYDAAKDEIHQLATQDPGGLQLLALAVATRTLAAEEAELKSITDSIVSVETHRAAADTAMTDTNALLAGLKTDLGTKKLAYETAADDPTKQSTAEAYQKALEALALAENKIATQEKLRDVCDEHLGKLRPQVTPQTQRRDEAKAKFDAAFDAARDETDEPTANKAVQAEKTRGEKSAAFAEITKELKILADKASLAESLVQEVKDQQALSTTPTDTEVANERTERKDALRTALDSSPDALDAAKAQWSAEIDGVEAMFEDDAEFRAETLVRLQSRRDAANDKLNTLHKDLQKRKAEAAKTDPSDQPAVTKAADDIAALETQLNSARAANEKLKSQLKSARVDDQRQKKLDDANIALARSVMEASATAVAAEKAEAEDTSDKVALRAAATKAAAQETMRQAERDRLGALIDLRDARNRERLARLSAAKTENTLTTMRSEVSSAPTPLSDDMQKLRDKTIPKFEAVKVTADNLVTIAETAKRAAEQKFNMLHSGFEAASRAFNAL